MSGEVSGLPAIRAAGGLNSDLINDQKLEVVIDKLSTKEQVLLSREYEQIPEACKKIWYRKYDTCELDFRMLSRNISTSDMTYFLAQMEHKRCNTLRFEVHKMQECLTLIEKSCNNALSSISTCEILPPSEDLTLEEQKNTQWPLYALPKLIPNLTELVVDIDVEVNFIDEFHKLQSLRICKDITQEALTSIFRNCTQLRMLSLERCNANLILHDIVRCNDLSKIILPVENFAKSSRQLLKLDLSVLAITCLANGDVSDCIREVVREKREKITRIDIDSKDAMNPAWKTHMGLITAQNIIDFKIVNSYHINNEELSTLIGSWPNLILLVLVNCPKLTGQLFFDILNIRKSLNANKTLEIKIAKCPALEIELRNVDLWKLHRQAIAFEILEDVRYTPFGAIFGFDKETSK